MHILAVCGFTARLADRATVAKRRINLAHVCASLSQTAKQQRRNWGCRHTMQLALLVAASAAAAFAPTPHQRIDTRLHFNFGNFGGGKKVDEKEAVKLAETVDVVGALPTEMAGLTPELDGLRKANALFNQGLISKDEIDEYADTLAAAKRKEVAEQERDAREAAEREAQARERTRAAARAATGAVGGLVGFVGRGA